MKKLIILTFAVVASIAVFGQAKAGKTDKTIHVTLNVCPVTGTIITNDPGKCPFCGMDLNLSPKEQIKTQVARAYSCPMYADTTTGQTGRKPNISPKEEMKMKVVRLSFPR